MSPSTLQFSSGNVSTDIFPDVYGWVLAHDVFQRWSQGNGGWQLHCIGGPGSGKSILSILVAKHLEQQSRCQNEEGSIITLAIEEDVSDRHVDMVEDFLGLVHRKLQERYTLQSNESIDFYEDYTYWRDVPEGSRRRERLNHLRKAVHACLEAVEDPKVYLILDGIDRCGPMLRFMLESELFDLQQRGTRILLTSRSAVFEQKEALCSHKHHGHVHGDEKPIEPFELSPLDLYMQCRNCEGFAICLACVDAKRICDRCHVSHTLYEAYKHVNIRLSVHPIAMAKFVAWDLEREHGDLGLGSSASKPPLSTLGESLISNQDARPIRKYVDDIVEFSYGNIGIAKARLDLVHEMESLEGLETKRDQLAAPVVALFDLGMKQIEAQPAQQRDVALKAIAAAARTDDGIPIPELRQLLKMLCGTDPRSGEELLEATRGWLVDIQGDPLRLQVYNVNFLYYVEQRYHRAIHRSSLQIKSSVRHKRAMFNLHGPDAPDAARFEPQNVFGPPGRVTTSKIARTATAMASIQEAPAQAFIVRKGTRAWI